MKHTFLSKIILSAVFFICSSECKTNAGENNSTNSRLPAELIQQLGTISFKNSHEGLAAAKKFDEKADGLYSRGSGKLYYLVGNRLLYKYDSSSKTEPSLVGTITPPHEEHLWGESLGIKTSYSDTPLIFLDLSKKVIRSSGKTTPLVMPSAK